MFKLKIAPRLMLLFLLVSLIPLASINLYWFNLNQNTLRANAASRQTLLTTTAAGRVNQFITDKVNLLIIHSQTDNVQNFNSAGSVQDFRTLINQDQDVMSVTLADATGMERVATNRNGNASALIDISRTDGFRAATFLSGKEYISPVSFDEQGNPSLEIAIPLVKYDNGQILSNLSTAQSGLIRDQSSIKGVLLARVTLGNIQQAVLSARLGSNGYAYLVDSHGALIAHPDAAFLKSHRNLRSAPEVANFLKEPYSAGGAVLVNSEKGVPVLSTYQPVIRTNWAVVAEEPVDSIFGAANHIARVGLAIFAAVGLAVVALSYLFSYRITKPIKRLAENAEQISKGILTTKVDTSRSDEIGTLSRSFSAMVDQLSATMRTVSAESNKLNVILNNTAEGVVAIDAEHVILVANTAAGVLQGKLVKDIIGQKIEDVFHLTREGVELGESFETAKVLSDVTLVAPSGKVHYLDILANPIANDPTGIKAIVTMIDKTEMRELENMKVDFVSMAAHELRTPLTAIKGYIDLIAHDNESRFSDQTDLFLKRLKYSSSQSVGLINNLLNVSRIERGALTVAFDKVKWTELVNAAIDDQQLVAKIKNISLCANVPDEEIFVLADRLAITEVLNNLVGNALKYTAEGGTVDVVVRLVDGVVTTSVKDTGMGMPVAALDQLFTKFYRVNGGLASGSGGTGLGLYISKSIVELHAGKIRVESIENEGSTFSFTLPNFEQSRYDELKQNGQIKESQVHGWSTKNITR